MNDFCRDLSLLQMLTKNRKEPFQKNGAAKINFAIANRDSLAIFAF
jgi:hypothetical protein